jgi:probable HAF family extracellular repeat protein
MAPLRGDSSCDAVAINAAGQVVGSSSGTREHAFRWDPRTGTQGLGSLGGDSEASGLNAGGQVIGTSTTRAGQQHAFRWDPGSGMRDLGTLGGTWSQPYGINDAGVVVGQSQTRTGLRAFRWEPRTGMRDLGTLGGAASLAVGITGGGLVIGQADTGSGAAHAFVWDPRRGMRDLGTLPGHAWSAAAVVNGRGQVAGVSAGQVDRAVLFSPRVTVAVRAVSVRTRVHLDVDPNLGSGSWLVRVQRRQADRTWATLPTRYRTWGTAETRTLDLPQGTYRVVVPSQHGYRWAASEAVYLRR